MQASAPEGDTPGKGLSAPVHLLHCSTRLSSPLPVAPPMPLNFPASQGMHMGTVVPGAVKAQVPGPQ